MARSVKLLPFAFQPEGDCIELVGIADLHYGSAHFLEKKALKHRAYILDDPDRKVIDLGDGTENSIRTSPGSSIFQQTCPPREQRLWVQGYYRPMRERVLAVVASNHSDRSDREVDWNPDETLVAFLDCAYVRWEAVLSITVGDSRHGQNYNICVRHMISNSSKPAVILGAMFSKSRTVQGCDAYWFAHCHQYLYEPLPADLPDSRHKKMRKLEQHFIMSDAFIDFDESYAEQHNYSPPTPGQVSLKLYRDQHRVEVKRLLYP
jgi:hypothetical protein